MQKWHPREDSKRALSTLAHAAFAEEPEVEDVRAITSGLKHTISLRIMAAVVSVWWAVAAWLDLDEWLNLTKQGLLLSTRSSWGRLLSSTPKQRSIVQIWAEIQLRCCSVPLKQAFFMFMLNSPMWMNQNRTPWIPKVRAQRCKRLRYDKHGPIPWTRNDTVHRITVSRNA